MTSQLPHFLRFHGTPCLLAGVLATLSPGAGASEPPSLSRASVVGRALRESPRVAAARAVEAQAQARAGQARSAAFPDVTLTLGVGPSLQARLVPGSAVASTEDAYGDVGLDDLSVTLGGQLSAVQPLYTFGKIGERQRAARLELEARRAQTGVTGSDVAFEAAQIYEGLLLARDAERFLAETERWLQLEIEHTEEAVRDGTDVTQQDVLRLQAGLGLLRLSRNQATAGLHQAEAGLRAYLGYDAGIPIEPKEASLEALPAPTERGEALIRLALERRPELRALQAGSRAFDALAAAESAGNWPDFFAALSVSGAYTPGRDLVDSRFVVDPLYHFVPSALLGLRWKLQGSMASERANEQHARADELLETQRWAQQAVPAEVTAALEEVRRAEKDVRDGELAFASAKQWMVRAGADFSVGLGDVRNVSDSAQATMQLRLATLDARYRQNVALAKLARATGTLAPDGPFYPQPRSSTPAETQGVSPTP